MFLYESQNLIRWMWLFESFLYINYVLKHIIVNENKIENVMELD